MFKKIILISAALVFALGILSTSVYQSWAQTVSETMEEDTVEFMATEAEETIPSVREPVDYVLAWPGILPDHFLYPVKMIRDRIWLFLTTDDYKKTELFLKYADKRIWAASMLADREKFDLAASTASKAEKYLERAIGQEKIAREKGEDTSALIEKLYMAALKHEEILVEIGEKVPESTKAVIENALKFPRDGYEEVKERMGDET